MSNFRSLNGYECEDATARIKIASLENRLGHLEDYVIEGYDATWITIGIHETAENFKDLYEAVLFNITDHSNEDYKDKKIDIFIRLNNNSVSICNVEELSVITEGADFDSSAYKIILSANNVTDGYINMVKYTINKYTDNTVIVQGGAGFSPEYSLPVTITGTVASNEATLLGKSVPYPTGFDKDNTMVLGVLISYDSGDNWSTFTMAKDGTMTDYANNLVVRLTDSNIILNNIYAYVNETGYMYRVTLMRYI